MKRSVSIVGLGRLGAPMAACFASKGHDVVGVDIREDVVDAINRGVAPVFEPGLDETIAQNADRLRATLSYEDAIAETDITFVVVATPSASDGGFSLRYVLPVCAEIGTQLKKKDDHLVVLTSTVMPGSTGGEVREALEASSGRTAGSDFGLCYNPEFIALGTVLKDLVTPDFVLVGETDERSGKTLESFYSTIHDAPVVRMNTVNAEIAKLAVNTFVTTKISFANMVAGICERLPHADVDVVTSALGRDRRIGSSYLKGALGYGGPCFPRDNVALSALARDLDAPSELAAATDALNRDQVPRVAALVAARVASGATVAVLGLSYKPDTDVVVESQGVLLARALIEAGFAVMVHDPAAMTAAEPLLAEARFVASAQEGADAADAVVLATPWSEYGDVVWDSAASDEKRKVVIDCWRMLDETKLGSGVDYVAVGRGGSTSE
ncbi:MAG: nucleotide sugar dehydrogenase [Actinomycetota bacterium]|nr:nucleotide sugar dehydrogenase [Actinomycetota bacterium]